MADSAALVKGFADDELQSISGIALAGKFLFRRDPAGVGSELWQSDGTSSGTTKLVSVPGTIGYLSTVASKLALFADESNGVLWRSDGTSAGTRAIGDGVEDIYSTASLGNTHIVISAIDDADGDYGYNLHAVNAAGTSLTRIAGDIGASSGEMAVLGKYAYFRVIKNGHFALWRTDGTAAGTRAFYTSKNDDVDSTLTIDDGRLYFAVESKLFVTDGTTAGTTAVPWFGSNFLGGVPVRAGDRLYTIGRAGGEPSALWYYDSNTATTGKVGGLTVVDGGEPNAAITALAPLGESLIVKMYDADATDLPTTTLSRTTFFSVPARANTAVRLAELNSAVDDGVVVGNAFYFEGDDTRPDGADRDEIELWRTDGTAAGTRTLSNTFGYLHLGPENVVGETLYFVDSGRGSAPDELWKVNDPDAKPSIYVSATDAHAGESANPGTFTVTRVGSTRASITVNYAVAGSAKTVSDFVKLSGSVTLAAGNASATITVVPVDDKASEGPESVQITLSGSSKYRLGTASAVVIIARSDAGPTLSAIVSSGNVFQPLRLEGEFELGKATSVRFAYPSGTSIDVQAREVSNKAIELPLPPQFDPTTGLPFAGDVGVSVVQDKKASASSMLTVQPLPTLPSTLPAGAVMTSYLTAQVNTIDRVTKKFAGKKIANASFVASYDKAKRELNARITPIKNVQTGKASTYKVSIAGGKSANLTAAELKQMDQLYAALLASEAALASPSGSAKDYLDAINRSKYDGSRVQAQADLYGRGFWYQPITDATTFYSNVSGRIGTWAGYAASLKAALPPKGASVSKVLGAIAVVSEVAAQTFAGAAISYGASLDANPVDSAMANDRASEHFGKAVQGALVAGLSTVSGGLLEPYRELAQATTAVPRVSVVADADTVNSEGNASAFRIVTRGGNAGSRDVVVHYTMSSPKGPQLIGINGTDYERLSGSSALDAGKESSRVPVIPKYGSDREGVLAITMTLKNSPDGSYLLDGFGAELDASMSPQATLKLHARPDITVKAKQGVLTANELTTVTLTRSGEPIGKVKVDLNFNAGDAKAPANFETPGHNIANVVEFQPGESSKTFTVKALKTAVGKTITVSVIDRKTRYGMKTRAASIKIEKPKISIRATDDVATEDTSDTATFRIARTGDTKSALAVNVDRKGTASTKDYSLSPSFGSSVTIPAGKAYVDVKVVAKDDKVADAGESLTLTLTSAKEYDVDSSRATASVEIEEASVAGTYKGTLKLSNPTPDALRRYNVNLGLTFVWADTVSSNGFAGTISQRISGTYWDSSSNGSFAGNPGEGEYKPFSSSTSFRFLGVGPAKQYEPGDTYEARVDLPVNIPSSSGTSVIPLHFYGKVEQDGRITGTVTVRDFGSESGTFTLVKTS